MKYISITFTIVMLTLTACSPAAEPTINPAEIQGTAMAAALTMIAETQAAIPTATPLPPTEIPSATPFLTNTPLALTSPTLSIGVIPTNTPVSSTSGDPCNKPLVTWSGSSVKVTVVNNTNPKGTVTFSIYFPPTVWGDCGYIGRQFTTNTTFQAPIGYFYTSAFVDGPKDFKVFGSGNFEREGNYSLWVENHAIIQKAGCAPNC